MFLRFLFAFSIMGLFACTPKALPPQQFTPGAVVDTIQSEVSLSFSSTAGSGSGRGYLVYRGPDRLHLVILTPFGTTYLEAIVNGEVLTVAISSQEIAYTGSFSEIPPRSPLADWKALRWIIDRDPALFGSPHDEAIRTNRDGKRETLWYNAAGLLARKETQDGDEVVYRDYRSYGGAPLPSVIEYRNQRGGSLKIAFDEPEVNRPVEDQALQPHLDGYTILPISRIEPR